jgi:hypothetical protein
VPPQGPFDRARVNGQAKTGSDALGKSGRPQRRIGEPFLAHEGHDGIVHFVSAARAPLTRKKTRQASPLEGRPCLVDRRPRKSEILCGAANRFAVDPNAPEHLILDLDQIVRVEETILVKEFVSDSLGMMMKGAETAQGLAFAIGGRSLGHPDLLVDNM